MIHIMHLFRPNYPPPETKIFFEKSSITAIITPFFYLWLDGGATNETQKKERL